MAWGSNTNPVAIGAATRKVDYDDLWDKLQYIRTDVIPAATKMLFGQAAAPQGWTKDTATWTDNSMIVFTTGTPGSGGSVSASAHTHTGPSHNHQWYSDQGVAASDKTYNSGGSPIDILAGTDKTDSGDDYLSVAEGGSGFKDPGMDMHTDLDGTGATGASNALYQEVIAASKDTYT